MKIKYLLLLFAFAALSACKKEKINPTPEVKAEISYQAINKNVKLSDPKGVELDVNEDGKMDIYFVMGLLGNSTGDHLYFFTSTVGNNYIKMGPHSDDLYMNSGEVTPHTQGQYISTTADNGLIWDDEFGVFAIRSTSTTATTWTKFWSAGQELMLAIKMKNAAGKFNYGWVKIRINKNTEQLMVIDCAWNKLADEALLAGVH